MTSLRPPRPFARRIAVLGIVAVAALAAFAPAAAADVTIGNCKVVSNPGTASRFTNCGGTNLTDQDLSGLDLRGANFDTATLVRANLSKTDLSPVADDQPPGNFRFGSFKDTDLTGANFAGADMRFTQISVAQLKGVNFAGADLRSATIYGGVDATTSFRGTKLDMVHWLGITTENTNLSGVSAGGADFSGGRLVGADFTSASLAYSRFRSGQLAGTNFTKANLNSVDLWRAAGSANFTNASMQSASLRESTLIGANFTNADLSCADFTKSNLWNATLTGAKFDCSTLVPQDIAMTGAVPTKAFWSTPYVEGVSKSCLPASGSVFNVGVTKVACTVTSDANATSGTGTFLVKVQKPTVGKLSLSKASLDYGSKVPVTAVVSIKEPVPGLATFLIDSMYAARPKVSTSGTATLALPTNLAPGRHTIGAMYVPTSQSYLPPKIASTTLTVRAASATTLTATGTTQPIRTKKPVRVTATVTLVHRETRPEGKVSFQVDGKQWALLPVVSGKATSAVPASVAVGRHKITARFLPTTPAFQATSVAAARILTVTAH